MLRGDEMPSLSELRVIFAFVLFAHSVSTPNRRREEIEGRIKGVVAALLRTNRSPAWNITSRDSLMKYWSMATCGGFTATEIVRELAVDCKVELPISAEQIVERAITARSTASAMAS